LLSKELMRNWNRQTDGQRQGQTPLSESCSGVARHLGVTECRCITTNTINWWKLRWMDALVTPSGRSGGSRRHGYSRN